MTTSGQQIILSLGAAAVAGLLLLQHHSQSKLQQENQSLRKQADQVALLLDQNERLSNKVVRLSQSESGTRDQFNELVRLRKEVATLRQEKKSWQNQRAALATRPATPRQAAPPAVTRAVKVPRDSWAFAGYATPEAALQTVLWAMSQGKLDTYRSSMTSEGRELFVAHTGSRSDTQIASTLASAIRDLTELPIDEKRVSAEGTVSFVIGTRVASDENEDGTAVQTQEDVLMSFQNVGGQWKYSPE